MYKDKFIAFIDILGFEKIIIEDKISLDEILAILDEFSMREGFTYTSLCPESKKIKDNFDLSTIQISDSLIVSSEVSIASAINLLFLCKRSIFRLAKYGLLCRGYITRGEVYHTQNQVIGKGYIEAFTNECKYSLPYTRIDEKLYTYILQSGDACAIEMFKRLTKNIDTDIVLFPIHNMVYVSSISGKNNVDDEKKEIEFIIDELKNLKTLTEKYIDHYDKKVEKKWKEFEKMIDEKITENINAKESIDKLSKPFLRRLVRS